jgi:hypothetical protein
MFVSDPKNRRLLRFQDGSGDLAVSNTDAALFYSPGGLYVSQGGRYGGRTVQKWARRYCDWETLPEDMQFETEQVFLTNEGMIYLLDNLKNRRILRMNPAPWNLLWWANPN